MPGLLDIPNELVPDILGALSTTDLIAAISATPLFNNVWKSCTALVSREILSKTIECYPEALELDKAIHTVPAAGYEAVLSQHRRIYLGARSVSEIYREFLDDLGKDEWPRILHTTSRDILERRATFKRAFYWAWMYALTDEFTSTSLAHWTPRDMAALAETHVWLRREESRLVVEEKTSQVYGGPVSDEPLVGKNLWQTYVEQMWDNVDFYKVGWDWERELQKNEVERELVERHDNTFGILLSIH